MRVLIANDGPFAHYYERLGIARAFSAMGWECELWDINKRSAFDAFDEKNPDIFIGQAFNLTKGHIKCFKERPNLKIALKAGDWSPFTDSIDKGTYPILRASKKEIELTKELANLGNPLSLFVHYTQKSVNKTHENWLNLGINVISMMNGADVFDYTNGIPREEYKCEVGFVGGNWAYKSKTLDPYMVNLCLKNKHKIKIFGNQPWGVPQYCGNLPNEQVKHFFSSCDICPSISEKHSQDFGYDIIERPFKLLANKCFVISDYVKDLEELIPDGIVYAKTPALFETLVTEYLKKPELRNQIAETGYKNVINHHTYFHRVAGLLDSFEMEKEKQLCLDSYEKVRKHLGL